MHSWQEFLTDPNHCGSNTCAWLEVWQDGCSYNFMILSAHLNGENWFLRKLFFCLHQWNCEDSSKWAKTNPDIASVTSATNLKEEEEEEESLKQILYNVRFNTNVVQDHELSACFNALFICFFDVWKLPTFWEETQCYKILLHFLCFQRKTPHLSYLLTAS